MIFAASALAFAVLEAWAVSQNKRGIESVSGPTVMICLFAWLYTTTGLEGTTFWFGLGLLFSLAGVLLLLWPARFFAFGMLAFLLTHIAYLIGLSASPPALSSWNFILAVLVGLSAARLLRRMLNAVRENGQRHLALAITAYGSLITLMLLSALLTLSNLQWSAGASLSVSFGAFSLCLSSVILAWIKYLTPISNGHLLNIALHRSGQIALIGGVIMQFP